MTAERPTVTPAATPPRLAGPRPNIRAFREEVLAKQGGEAVFIDVRSPEEYRGELALP
jgi:thiosulfate/3-mercaptopyruvate sulfurtransferase